MSALPPKAVPTIVIALMVSKRAVAQSLKTIASRLLSFGCPLWAINVRFASRRTAARFASLFDEAGGVVRDMTEIDRTGEHA
jgi:hypothetical protein